MRPRLVLKIVLGVIVVSAVAWIASWGQSFVTTERELRVDYILTPKRVERLPHPLGSGFDVAATGNIVIQAGGSLLELEADPDGLVADRFSSSAPDNFTFDRGTTLLTITGQYFGQLDEAGKFSKAVPLPAQGMRLAPSTVGGAVYVFGGPSLTNRRVYAISAEGKLAVIAEVLAPVVAVADSSDAIYIATAREIFKVAEKSVNLVVRVPISTGVIHSLAVCPDNHLLFFSTRDRVYAMQGLAAIAIVKNVGGALRLHDGTLYLWDARRHLLLSFPEVEKNL
jgi:hypothetical protein